MRAMRRSVRTVAQAFQAAAFVSRQPAVKRPPRDLPLAGHLAYRPTVSQYSLDRFVPLLSHAHLPHARESDKSAEVAVTHHPKFCDTSAEGLLGRFSRTCTQHSGARAGSRTLNLGIKSPLLCQLSYASAPSTDS